MDARKSKDRTAFAHLTLGGRTQCEARHIVVLFIYRNILVKALSRQGALMLPSELGGDCGSVSHALKPFERGSKFFLGPSSRLAGAPNRSRSRRLSHKKINATILVDDRAPLLLYLVFHDYVRDPYPVPIKNPAEKCQLSGSSRTATLRLRGPVGKLGRKSNIQNAGVRCL